jgi:hypothetical protein
VCLRPEDRGGRSPGVGHAAAIVLGPGMGHRFSLFETMSGNPPATSRQIAEAAELNELAFANGSPPWSRAGSWAGSIGWHRSASSLLEQHMSSKPAETIS